MASPCSKSHVHFNVGGPSLNMVFQAASDDDLPIFKELVVMLDMGRGHLKEAIEALRVEDVGELEGFSALHAAAKGGARDVCRYLVKELLVDVDVVDKKGRTPLFFAIHSKNVGTAKYLLYHGANQDKASHDGLSLLHSAALSDNCEMIELLLAKGAYVDPVADGGTPLHFAASEGHYGTMKILLDYNADYNKMVNGETPLIAATCADSNSMECMMLLVKAIALHPDDATTFSNRSLCCLVMGDRGQALADANQCRKLCPDWPKACYRQGAVLMSLKDYEGASERFLDGLKLDPANAEIEDALREAMESLRTSRSTKAK